MIPTPAMPAGRFFSQKWFRPLPYLLSLVALPLWAQSADDDWLGLEPVASSTRLGWVYSRDQQELVSNSVYLQQTLSTSTSLALDFSRDRLPGERQTFNSDDLNATFQLAFGPVWSGALGYRFQGQSRELEIRQSRLQLDFAPGPLFLSLQRQQGELRLYPRDDLTLSIDLPEYIGSDLDSTAITLGWWFDSLTLSGQYIEIDYQRDLARLAARPLFQLLVKPAVLAQSGLLISRQTRITLEVPWRNESFALQGLSSTSVLDRSSLNSLQLNWTHMLDQHFSSQFQLSRNTGSEPNWSVGIGLEWNT